MRASRLLSTLMLLQVRGQMTAQALADEFEVSVRTIYRDIDHLSAAGVPVYADRGPGGGFALLDGYRTKLTGLSTVEASTLFLAGLPGPAAELGLADVLATAQLKLTAALPEGARADARRVAARFHLDPVGWFSSAGSAELLPAIAQAVWTERELDIVYQRLAKTVLRRVRPLGLVLKGGVWYLVAQVGDATRTYRVSNILGASVREERFERPALFDLAKFWTTAARDYERGLHRGAASLRMRKAAFWKLGLLGSAIAQAAGASAGDPDEEGWVKIVIPIESIDQAARDLVRLGPDAEVLEPLALRETIGAYARSLVELYAPGEVRPLE